MEDYSDLSIDDLIFEVRRLKQRSQVLEDDKRILQTELEIAQSGKLKNSTNSSDSDNKKLKEEASHLRSMVTMFSQKYRLVQTFLLLERKTLQEVRAELSMSLDAVQKDTEHKLQLVVNSVQHREFGLHKKLQGLTLDLLKEKEKNDAACSELSATEKENSRLVKLLDQTKNEFDIERSNMKDHFDRISSKIDTYQQMHAQEVAALQADILSKDQAQLDLESRSALLEKQVEINTTAMSRLKEGYMGQIDGLERQCEEHVIALNSLRQTNRQLDSDNSSLTKENSDLQKKITVLKEQQEKLLQSHDDVSSDLRAVLAREESLRMELHGTSSDRGDMQRRLKSITDKVREMEVSHKEEIAASNSKIDEANGTIAGLMRSVAKEKQQAESARVQLTVANDEVQARDGVIRGQTDEIAKLNAQIDKMRTKVETMEKDLKDNNSDIMAVRSDRDEALQRTAGLAKDLSILREEATDKDAEIKELNARLENAMAARKTDGAMERELEEQTRRLEEKKVEIAGLKDTIRRECEERTEMMLEMSELRDQIRRLSSLNLRSQSSSGGVDSGQQAGAGIGRRDDSRTSSTVSPGLEGKSTSMLNQLAASSGASSNGMSDAAWSQRLAKQGSMGVNAKGKRKSQYR